MNWKIGRIGTGWAKIWRYCLFLEIGRSSSLTEGIWPDAKRMSQAWGKGLAHLRSFLTFTKALCTSDPEGSADC